MVNRWTGVERCQAISLHDLLQQKNTGAPVMKRHEADPHFKPMHHLIIKTNDYHNWQVMQNTAVFPIWSHKILISSLVFNSLLDLQVKSEWKPFCFLHETLCNVFIKMLFKYKDIWLCCSRSQSDLVTSSLPAFRLITDYFDYKDNKNLNKGRS